jgi:tetratricopeptide (TPR) repeat protein
MEERHGQIREGAGLEESRLNVEFIDFLKKWSTPALVVIAVVAIGYFGLLKYREYEKRAHDDAFMQLEAAATSGSPAGLLAVAADHPERAAIAELARLYAADLHLDAARSGLAPGAVADPATGRPPETDLLTPEQRSQQLDSAEKLYQLVVDRTIDKPAERQLGIGALYGLAAVAESRGKFDDARRHYERIIDVATKAGLEYEVSRAQSRIDSLPDLQVLPVLLAETDLPPRMSGTIQPITDPFLTSDTPPPPDIGGPLGPDVPQAPTPLTPDAPPTTPAPEQPAPEQPAPANPPAGDQPTEPSQTPPATPPPAPPPPGQ